MGNLTKNIDSIQVVGLIWLNPLHRKDYPTEWELLWVMGKVAPNKEDDMLKKKPQKFSTIQYVSVESRLFINPFYK